MTGVQTCALPISIGSFPSHDMVAVAQDAIVADNLYLAFEVDDLLNLEPAEFKKEVVELLKKYEL